jgi:YidC/Oxa1 family membrane protein insertase
MFTTYIVQPLFNILVLIYALIPGHNFGLSIIIFTIFVRLAMWPLVKKQLHHAKAMRELQPELKRIKKETKGDRQKESVLVMELYKERQINPLSSIGLLAVQLPILIALYAGLSRVIRDPQTIVNFSYPFVQNLSWIKTLASDISKFDATLFGVVDLKRAALPQGGGFYFPAFLIVAGSAVAQFFQTKQLMPDSKDSKGLKQILNEATAGKQAESSDVNAAVGKSTRYLIPIMIFVFTISLPAALPLYWLVTGLIAILQQQRIMGKEETALETVAEDSSGRAIEGEVIPPKTAKKSSAKNRKTTKKRRRK